LSEFDANLLRGLFFHMRNFLPRKLLLALIGATLLLTPTLFAAFPTARTSSRMVFDASLGRIVLFGGVTSPDNSGKLYDLGDTWAWTGLRWVRLYPAHHPSARSGETLVWDGGRSRILLFGGVTGTTSLDDTWVFENGDWRDLALSPAPSPRAFAAGMYDPASDKVVFYGGGTTTVSNFDTWTFNGSAWTQLTDGDPRLNYPMMVYDELRHQLLLVGAQETTREARMYVWSGSGWTRITPAHLPACVQQGAITYEQHNDRVLLIAGTCTTGVAADETWEWDGIDWTKLSPSPTHGFVSGVSLAYDVPRQHTIMYGGYDSGARSSTYRYRDNVWTLLDDIFTPGPSSLFVFENDPAHGVSWLFGGHNDQGQLSDFWQLSAGNWKLIKETGAPVACFFPAGAFDSDRGKLVLLCDNAIIYEWDGSAWKSFTGLKTKPATRRWEGMVYDAQLHKTVVFGGFDGSSYLKDTWTWDGASWTQIGKGKTSPNPRSLSAIFFDPTQNKTFLFGGIGRPTTNDRITRYGDMWSFDGSKWTELTALTAKPTVRYGAQVRFNPDSQKVVLFGGKDANEIYLGDQWEWNGSTWAKVNPTDPPSARMNGGLIFDAQSSKMLLFGGYAGLYFSELWQMGDDNTWQLQKERSGRNRIASSGSPATPEDGGSAIPLR
jgi:hypothetical protein